MIRYAVVGTGMMGVEHIGNIAALDDAVVTAICDPHEPSLAGARAAIEAAGMPPAEEFTDHRALLDADVCDAVVIATPNHLHVAPVLDAMAAGRHVLVEKPLCHTVADCRTLVDAAADHDGVVWVGLEYRYMPAIARLVEEVHGGAVGRLRMLSIREHRFPFLMKVDDWNRFSANTGGTLVEKCCHYFDLMNLITQSRPRRVFASGGQDVNHLDEVYDGRPSDILDNAFVIVEFDDGVRAMLDLCMFAEATRHQEELVAVGDAGKVEAKMPASVLRRGRRGEHWIGGVDDELVRDERIRHQGVHHGSSYLEHLGFRAAILDGTAPDVTLTDGMWAVAVGAAAHRSIAEGRPVEMSEFAELT